jgi:hypothetical protein
MGFPAVYKSLKFKVESSRLKAGKLKAHRPSLKAPSQRMNEFEL